MLELFYIFLVASFSLIGFHIYRLTSLMHYFFFLFSIYLFLLWFIGEKIVIEIDFKIQYIDITSVKTYNNERISNNNNNKFNFKIAI